MTQRISMRDIAARAGVSVMTVSLALRESRRISAATRERVQAIAAGLGFQPDPALQALVTYRHHKQKPSYLGVVAYINNFEQPSIINSIPLHQDLFNGAKKRGDQLGFKVEEFWLREPNLNPRRISGILSSRGIQGLIIGPQPEPCGHIALDWTHFAAVQLGYSLQSPRFHTIITDQFQSITLIMRRLCALGYRRIGLVIRNHQDERSESRYSGAYLAAQHKLPPRLPRIPILSGEHIGEAAFRAWFERWKPDALMGPTLEPIPYLKKMGLRIPQDVGCALSYQAERDGLRFAHSEGRREAAGALAIEHLSGMLARNELGVPPVPTSLLVSADWIPGDTIRQVGPPVPLA